jgi:transposase
MSVVTLAPLERKELERLARSRTLAPEMARRRAKMILMLPSGGSYRKISKRLSCTFDYISYWKRRFKERRLIGLDSRGLGAVHRRSSAQIEARILEMTRRKPTDGSTHWSSHRLAKEVGAGQSTVSRVWRRLGIRPPRWPVCIASDDPGFEEKAADIAGLFIRCPMHAAVFCVGEKSAIHSMDDLDVAFPLSPGCASGALSLYRALSTQAERVFAPTSGRRIRTEIVDFLAQIVMNHPAGREVHVIVNNSSADRTKKFFKLLETSPAIRIHYAPTYSSWVNQVKIWISKIHRDVGLRGVCNSMKGFEGKLMRYIRTYHKCAIPIRWIY